MNRGREVWSEVEPFMLLGRTGAVPSAVRPFAAAVAALTVPLAAPPEAESRPVLELVPGQGEPVDGRSTADLLLLPRPEVGP
ncbi:hypothetical protein ACFFQW_40495 [Umezawaea endophytica]|uniref:Uncharacterized protein n=1 Tax=Umezawaea endophytica TaxID=1654476 RepID=A0A9X2VWK5_9PSEU|nr:hypothetical protein [Umezawaea endophytica]MCS7484173.1 hypothetical protein [Umezawaea endophytica]